MNVPIVDPKGLHHSLITYQMSILILIICFPITNGSVVILSAQINLWFPGLISPVVVFPPQAL